MSNNEGIKEKTYEGYIEHMNAETYDGHTRIFLTIITKESDISLNMKSVKVTTYVES